VVKSKCKSIRVQQDHDKQVRGKERRFSLSSKQRLKAILPLGRLKDTKPSLHWMHACLEPQRLDKDNGRPSPGNERLNV
jgi:hypothetical protein